MFTVVRCGNCKRCWGIVGKGKKCPHCGHISDDNIQIVSVVDNANDLQKEVALANMPDNLRGQFRDKLSTKIVSSETPSASKLLDCIRIAAIDGVVGLERLAGALRGKGISLSAEDVAEEAVSQGLLMRTNDGFYVILQ